MNDSTFIYYIYRYIWYSYNFILNIFIPIAAEALVREFDSPHLRLQLDIFHLQFLKGDLTNNIKRLLPIVGK